jgi:hypothetical protein
VVRASDIVICAVGHHVPGCGPPREERSPPPLVVLGAQVQIAQDECNLSTGDEEDEEGEGEKAKEVVKAVLPD